MLTGRHLVALNAAAADSEQWVHLLPAGRFAGRDGRGPYEMQDAAAVIEATRQDAGRRQLPVDYDHAIDLAAPAGGQAIAAGWIRGLQARPNGIWGWSPGPGGPPPCWRPGSTATCRRCSATPKPAGSPGCCAQP